MWHQWPNGLKRGLTYHRASNLTCFNSTRDFKANVINVEKVYQLAYRRSGIFPPSIPVSATTKNWLPRNKWKNRGRKIPLLHSNLTSQGALANTFVFNKFVIRDFFVFSHFQCYIKLSSIARRLKSIWIVWQVWSVLCHTTTSPVEFWTSVFQWKIHQASYYGKPVCVLKLPPMS